MKKYVIACIIIFFGRVLFAQTINPDLLRKEWSANWITVPGTSPAGYGVYYFRKTFSVVTKPSLFIVHVSADNRYQLFINGVMASLGPARGDLYYWNFETVDISHWLLPGKNAISAIVWNEGESRPEGQISNRTAFVLQGDQENEAVINTNDGWKCLQNNAYTPLTGIGYNTYYVAGAGELVDMHAMPPAWMSNDFEDAGWLNAVKAVWNKPNPKGVSDIPGWMLVPSALPQMEITPQRFAAVRSVTGISTPVDFPEKPAAITVAANTTASILLDQNYLTNAYPVIHFSKGNNAALAIIYAETLFSEIPNGNGKNFHKGNRNEVSGKFIAGRKDSIISNGLNHQQFTTLNWRTFRYVQLTITTKDEPLIIDDIYSLLTGYPFALNARFDAKDTTLDKILETGWRTARSCAMETYMDCPYYEQLQYIGDIRIQALVSLYNSGDDRLVRNAINQADHSRIAEGITLSRHPSFSPQQIPTFSLWYIGLVHDYWMYRGDSIFIKEKLQGIRNVLWFFSKYQQADGSLRNVPYWNFTDWVDDDAWQGGVAPIGSNGSSALQDLQLLWAYQLAAMLESQLGMPSLSAAYGEKALQLSNTIQRLYWDEQRRLYADNSDRNKYSQHANALAILTGVIKENAANELAQKIRIDASLAKASVYFKYYLHQALVKAGLGNDYLNWLGIWKENLKYGLTTWAESSDIDKTRSDCHAWGASPNIEFYRTVLGIDTDAPGFKKIKIEPHPGSLTHVQGKIPHPAGTVSVSYQLINGKWKIDITLPQNTPGILIWKTKNYPLLPGKNLLSL